MANSKPNISYFVSKIKMLLKSWINWWIVKILNHILCLYKITTVDLNGCLIVDFKRVEFRFGRSCV